MVFTFPIAIKTALSAFLDLFQIYVLFAAIFVAIPFRIIAQNPDDNSAQINGNGGISRFEQDVVKGKSEGTLNSYVGSHGVSCSVYEMRAGKKGAYFVVTAQKRNGGAVEEVIICDKVSFAQNVITCSGHIRWKHQKANMLTTGGADYSVEIGIDGIELSVKTHGRSNSTMLP